MQFQLKTRQICLFIIAFLPITKFFTMPSIIARSSNEDLWISALISIIFDLVTVAVLTFICNKSKRNFFEILTDIFGEKGGKIIVFLYFIFFMLKAVMPLNEQKDYVENTLYILMPTLLYFLPFFFAAFYLSVKKLRVIGRISDVLWVFTIFGFLVLLTLSISNADFLSILPVGANGSVKIFNGTASSFSWFGDAAYLLFFINEFDCKKKDIKKIILSFLVSALLILIFLIVFYSVFTSIAPRQRFALTEISKYATDISNTGRLDYIGITLLLFSNIFALSIPLFFASYTLKYVFNFKKVWIAPLIVVLFHAIIIVFFSQYVYSIEQFMLSIGGYYILIFGNILPLLLPLFIKKEIKNEVQA